MQRRIATMLNLMLCWFFTVPATAASTPQLQTPHSELTSQVWEEIRKLTASDAAARDQFGGSVSISGDTVVVGAYSNDDSGSAYVFDRNQGGPDNWDEVKKLTASDAGFDERFGNSAAISGNTIVVGAWNDEYSSGSAYVFERDQGGVDNWGEVKKLTASDAATYDQFGVSVSVSGDTIVVGAWQDDDAGYQSGSAYVFERNQGGAANWGEVKKLTASDAAAYDQFGFSVSISGDTIVVGSVFDDDVALDSGSAYVFERNQGGADNWGEMKKLTASDAAAIDVFGTSVTTSGSTIVVGAYFDDAPDPNSGSAYVFERDHGGTDNWGEVKKLTASDATAGDEFGYFGSISGDIVVIGAFLADDVCPADPFNCNSGSAYVFKRNQGGTDNWGEVKKLTATDAAEGDNFGLSVSISGVTVVVGAPDDDDACSFCNSGSVYVFQVPPIFSNGFESGNTLTWSATVGGAR